MVGDGEGGEKDLFISFFYVFLPFLTCFSSFFSLSAHFFWKITLKVTGLVRQSTVFFKAFLTAGATAGILWMLSVLNCIHLIRARASLLRPCHAASSKAAEALCEMVPTKMMAI